MPEIAIDTNPLVYIYRGVDGLGAAYARLLGNLSEKKRLLIPKLVYAELSLIFKDAEELDAFIQDTGIIVEAMSKAAYLLAAEQWGRYNKQRVLICHECGAKLDKMSCEVCNSPIKIRQHILTDFLIGAFACKNGNALVTHDKGYFSTYFPELHILAVDGDDG